MQHASKSASRTGLIRYGSAIFKVGAAIACSLTISSCSAPAATAKASAETEAPKAEPKTEKMADRSPYTVEDWWPNRLDLSPLERSNSLDPMGDDFDYAAEFSKLDLAQVKKDVEQVLTDSKEWWPADWGHYGGLMIRLAWHSAGTYRVTDGRGGSADGMIRLAPVNSWPDNANLDKARRLLWPVKKKYGRALSWADLMILAGNVSLESMGYQTFGFAGGREDAYTGADIDWGPEKEWLADERFHHGNLKGPLAASMMGLIYVNPEGPNGNPDPKAAAERIRVTFGRMAMNDYETVALIAGGHTLGKVHGAHKASECIGPEPEGASIKEQGLGWKNKCGTGKGADTVTSGLEGAWTYTPTQWSQGYLENLFEYDWELTTSPGGAKQWTPKNAKVEVPDAHIEGKKHKPIMLTTDLALRFDPKYEPIARRFYENPEEFQEAFGKAWYKLTHRDMGPYVRLLGSEVPEPQVWQDPVPPVEHKLVGDKDIAQLKKQVLSSGLSVSELVRTAWASASTYRYTDMRGGANGARVRLAPQKDWPANSPAELANSLAALEKIQSEFNGKAKRGVKISMADLIVLGGAAAIEKAAKDAGVDVKVPFTPGRTDATAEMTDAESFEVLEPHADGFRNYFEDGLTGEPAEHLVDKASMLTLTAPEMTVLVGGLRVLGANYDGSSHGVFTENPGALSNDFFANLLDYDLEWTKNGEGIYEGRDRNSGDVRWTGTEVDLIFGSNSQLRGIGEVYAADNARGKFVDDFVKAWSKVMMLDRFDLESRGRDAVLTMR